MIGIELVAGFLVTWITRKVRKVASGVDAEVDAALDAGMSKLHELVTGKLAADPALHKLESEAAAGTDSPRTRDRVTLALEDACDADPNFAGRLRQILEQLEQARAGSGTTAAGDHGVAIGGNVTVRAERGSVAAVRMGDVSLGGGRADPPVPGQPSS